MSSGFVSGGTAGDEIERDAEWRAAAKAIEDARKAKEDIAKQNDGKTLFEILQANKEKKQAEFEEKARFKLHNALDDDEADYLDAVLEKKRRIEANLKKETQEQLDLFRQQQEEAERADSDNHSTNVPKDGEQWVAFGRKRKKAPMTALLRGVKLRKSSAASEENTPVNALKQRQSLAQDATVNTTTPTASNHGAHDIGLSTTASRKPSLVRPTAEHPNTLLLGLGYVSSEDES